jgi:formylglycine-generating enzyme required for sulfatase activity
MGHIFISYSHKDTVYAHQLAENLQSMGFEVWIDERLDYGSQWPQELQKQLDSCSAFIVIMSPRSYESEWVQSELQRARRKLKPIFPMLLEGEEPWLSVESTQYYDVRGQVNPDSRFYSALKTVMTPNPIARTLELPKGFARAKLAHDSSKLKMGIVIATIGVLLVSFFGGAALLMGPLLKKDINPTVPVVQSTGDGISPEELTSVPEATFTAETTLPPQITSIEDHEMALVPAGKFTMGRSAKDELADCQEFSSECNLVWFMDEEPVHEVYLDAFYIDIYEVTNALYEACEDQGVCNPPQSSNSSTHLNYYGNPEFDHYPVLYVNWNQARTYCESRGARLPTEAEWEKAARGMDGRMYPWGEELDEAFANFHWNVGDTTPVGRYENGKSPYGVYDMAGNVWEWVNSLHESYPYNANDGRESLGGEGPRVMRGGSWGYEGDNSISASYRFAFNPTDSNLDLGFRCARDADP